MNKYILTHSHDERYNKVVEADSFYIDENKSIVFSIAGKHVAAYLAHGFSSVMRDDFKVTDLE